MGLLAELADLGAHEVVTDPDPHGKPSAIRTYIECLRRVDSTHRLVFQDDATPCSGFRVRAEAALRERPDNLIAFFVPGMGLHGRWVRDAYKAGKPWVQLPTSANWMPTVALCWPRELAQAFVEYADAHVARRLARRMSSLSDDGPVGGFCRANKVAVWATVPCLVQHPDLVPSLVKRRSYHGRNPARRAAVYVDE